MGQGQLQRVGAGLYRLLENILLWDVRDRRFNPTCIPLTLFKPKPFRSYLGMTHPCCSGTETHTYKQGFKKALRGAVNGHKKFRLGEQSPWTACGSFVLDGRRTGHNKTYQMFCGARWRSRDGAEGIVEFMHMEVARLAYTRGDRVLLSINSDVSRFIVKILSRYC